MISNQQVVTDFRRILKHFKHLPSFRASNSSQRKELLQQYKFGQQETDTKRIEHMRQIAHNYATLVSDVREAKYLRGLDSGEKLDPRDKIKATAARVGLGVPQFSDEKMF